MNILFLSYWNASDPLTAATVKPHLGILSDFASVKKIIWVNVEREALPFSESIQKVTHIPFLSYSRKWGALGQIIDFMKAPLFLEKLIHHHKIDYLIARGSPAGALAHKVHEKTALPYMVESFEPHADYMLYSGTWSARGLKYRFQKRWEEQQKQSAQLICPVSWNYKKQLEQEGLPSEKIKVIPCEVNTQAIQFSEAKRNSFRQAWDWSQTVVGVYAGKFGGIYEEDEAFALFHAAFQVFGDSFRLLLLNGQPSDYIQQKLSFWNIDPQKVKHLLVPHHQISDYLSMADFAFACIKTSPVSMYCSPIKIGEYWAIGLPVIISEGIGDDSELIEKSDIGAVYKRSANGYKEALEKLQLILDTKGLVEKIKEMALKHRPFDAVKSVYAQIVNE